MEQKKPISFAYACKHGLDDIVIKYLEWKPDNKHEKWVEKLKKSDLIFTAIQKGYTKIVEIFINHGCDVRKKKNLALHLACLYGQFEIVKLLIEWSQCECDYNVNDCVCGKNNLAMQIAFSFGHMDIAKFLYNESGFYGYKPDSFCMEVAWEQQDRDKLQFMSDHGRVKFNEPYTVNTSINHYYKMKFLLCADIFQRIDKEDFLFYACCREESRIIEWLLLNYVI